MTASTDNNAQRGTKRKRYEMPKEDLQVKIAGKLHHQLKEVRKAAKKAKTFETQKLVKKLKGIRKNDGDSQKLVELEVQLEALKSINHELVANTALKMRLHKDRILSLNEHVRLAASQEILSTLILSASGTPAAKCESRLFSSKILAAEVASVAEDLRNLLQPKDKEKNYGVQDEDIGIAHQKKLKLAPLERDFQGVDLRSTHSEDQVEQTQDALPLDTLGSGSDIEDVNEAGWESGTIDDNEDDINRGRESDSSANAGDLGVPSNSKPSQKLAHSTVPTSAAIAKSPARQSTFLPSLSVGFVRGASDDSDFGENAATAGDIEFKKNRRGQRARRAIWEKKHGRNANHKKKEFEHRGATGNGQELRRGGTASGQPQDAPSRRQDIVRPHVRYGEGHANVVAWNNPLDAQGRKEDKPLHPSWEAKRKLKEKETAGIVPSQGKKIKFS